MTDSCSGSTVSKNLKAALAGSLPAYFASCSFIASTKSSPAEKCLPSPVKTMHLTSEPALPIFSKASLISEKFCQVSEFIFLGLLMLTIAI